MKTTISISIVLAMLFATTTNAQEISFLQRVSVGATFNQFTGSYYQFSSGFLTNHPNRALNATASIRLWKHLEFGGFASFMHCNPRCGEYSLSSSNRNFVFYQLSWNDNDMHLTGGFFIGLHSVSLKKRLDRDNYMDFVARGGWGLNGEVDGAWAGLGMEVRMTKQMLFTLYADYGSFTPMHRFDKGVTLRVCYGLKYYLK